MLEYKLTVEVFKTRLDKYLAENLKDISRNQIQREIEAGYVFVNGEKVSESKFVVRKNDKIVFLEIRDKRKEISLKPVNLPLKVLYDDHGLLIIDKPAGLPMHPGAGFKGTTLASALLYQFKDIKFVGEEDRPGIVHRLDKDTSGVVLVAKTPEMYEYLKDAFAERKIKKEYITLVLGKVEKLHGFIETPIGKSKKDFRKYDVAYEIRNPQNTKKLQVVEAKDALTEYKILEYLESENRKIGKSENRNSPTSDLSDYSGARDLDKEKTVLDYQPSIDSYTLLLVKLHTGRTHQIRVHFNSINHPVIGDGLYGGKRSNFEGLNRQFLHARKIEVKLPDGTWIEAESQLPEDLCEVLESLHSKKVEVL